MDEYKEYLYLRRPQYRGYDVGDLSEQLEIRERLKCKPFKWFMKEIAFDLPKKYPPVEPPDFASGEIRSKADPTLCVDTQFKHENERFSLELCVKDGSGRSGEQVQIFKEVIEFLADANERFNFSAIFTDVAQRYSTKQADHVLGRFKLRSTGARPFMELPRLSGQSAVALRSRKWLKIHPHVLNFEKKNYFFISRTDNATPHPRRKSKMFGLRSCPEGIVCRHMQRRFGNSEMGFWAVQSNGIVALRQGRRRRGISQNTIASLSATTIPSIISFVRYPPQYYFRDGNSLSLWKLMIVWCHPLLLACALKFVLIERQALFCYQNDQICYWLSVIRCCSLSPWHNIVVISFFPPLFNLDDFLVCSDQVLKINHSMFFGSLCLFLEARLCWIVKAFFTIIIIIF